MMVIGQPKTRSLLTLDAAAMGEKVSQQQVGLILACHVVPGGALL